MDQESIVYGCIKDIADMQGDSYRRRVNREAMLQLPRMDEWPYLCQEMFSLPRVEFSLDSYQTDVMHFGASYKAVEYEWGEWIGKFEALLSNMYWISAVVHLETELAGVHTFTWDSKNDGHKPGADIKHVNCSWVQENSFI